MYKVPYFLVTILHSEKTVPQKWWCDKANCSITKLKNYLIRVRLTTKIFTSRNIFLNNCKFQDPQFMRAYASRNDSIANTRN